MRTNLKISLCVLVAFSISFSVLLLFLITNPLVSDDGVFIFFHPSDREHAKFYSQNFISDEKKIFIYGSSMVWPLNPGLIEENLKKNELDYKIYNLGIGGSKPENNEKFLDMIISAQPDIVAYGISDRDFITDEWVIDEEKENFFRLEKPPQVLPEPSRIFGELFASAKVVLNFDTDFLRSPQANVIHVLRGPLKADLMEVVPEKEIEKGKEVETYLEDLPPVIENKNVLVINNIITKLRENNIDVIIFVPPVHKFHIEHLSDNQQKYFSDVLKTVSDDSKIHIYSFYDYYRDLNIWYDFIHVTTNTDHPYFSDDFSDILIKEISS